MSWNDYKPAEPLPRWWPVTVRRIIKRDPVCRCAGCPKCSHKSVNGKNFCARASTEADHAVPRSKGGSNKDDNLRGMCTACHGHKTALEGVAAREERKRPTGFFDEDQPGRLW